MEEKAASQTSVLVCQARAVADGRLAAGRFADPVAITLLAGEERAAVETARRGTPPGNWRLRPDYELLTATAHLLATRTVAIDDAVRRAGNPQLVLLGAGLDARAWRMRDLAGVTVFEVDHPASQRDKRARLGDLAPCAKSVSFVPVQFGRDDLGAALAAAGHDAAAPATWIWEGVLPYLTQPQVDEVLRSVAGRSAPGSRLIASYTTRNRIPAAGRLAMGVIWKLAGTRDPMADERHISAWSRQDMRALLAGHGFTVTGDEDQLSLARQLGITPRRPRILAMSRVVTADRA